MAKSSFYSLSGLNYANITHPPVNTSLPVISGTPTVGVTLSTTNGTWSHNPTTFTYQWLRNGSPISGAISSSYLLVTADVGNTISVSVTATNTDGSATATSAPTSTVSGIPVAPVNTVLPVISGTPLVGSTLSTTDGTWINGPTSFSYQWKRGGVDIAGATNNTYALVHADAGSTITVAVTAANAGGSNTATSAATSAINEVPSNTALPSITGPGTVDGDTLTVIAGTWLGFPTPTLTYQWMRAGVDISGATGTNYTLVTADVGSMISVRETATNTSGSANATSSAVGPVTSGGSFTPSLDFSDARNSQYIGQLV